MSYLNIGNYTVYIYCCVSIDEMSPKGNQDLNIQA